MLPQVWKRLKIGKDRLNITQKFIGYFLLLSIIPILVIGVTAYNVSYSLFRDQNSRRTQGVLKAERQYLELYFSPFEDLMINIANMQILSDLMQPGHPSVSSVPLPTGQAIMPPQIISILDHYLYVDGLVSLDLLTRTDLHLHAGDTLSTNSVRTDQRDQLYLETLYSGKPVYWTGVVNNINVSSKQEKVISAVRILSVINPETLQPEESGLLVVNLSLEPLYRHFDKIEVAEGGYLLIVDAKGRIVYSPQRNQMSQLLDASLLQELGHHEILRSQVDGEAMIVSAVTSEHIGWKIISFTPVSTFTSSMLTMDAIITIVLIFCLAVVAVGAWKLNREMVAPVRQIIQQFKQMESGTFDWKQRLIPQTHDEFGELVLWFNTFLDHVVSVKRLKESEERYALAARAANDGLWDWNLDTNEIYLSPRWKAVLGYTEREIGSLPDEWFSRVHEEDREMLKIAISAHLEGHTASLENEHRILHKDGMYRWVFVRGMAVRDANDKPYRMAGSHTEITARKNAEARLLHDAFHDSLTGLPNRMLFMDRLQRAFLRINRADAHLFAVLFLDLDRFKDVNDSMGHGVGDLLLIEIAHRLEGCLRAVDTVARLGGDEFVILLEDIAQVSDVVQVAERIQSQVNQPFLLSGHSGVVTASIGIVLGHTSYSGPEEMLRDGDIAMYRAKAMGKARYEIFEPLMREQVLGRVVLEADLRKALEQNALFLQYQPIIALDGYHITGFEALLRWKHPELGLISPARFIPLAEDTGLILPIGAWVMREACRQVKQWQDQFPMQPHLTISVNLSAIQIAQVDLIAQVQRILQETGIPPECLILEVTESAIVRDIDLATQRLEALKQLGVKAHMDDFGTGYSTLSNLRFFPLETIKIDKSFIASMSETKSDLGVVRAIVLMAHELGMKIVAEGIENIEQYDQLRDLGCEFGQGFFISKPLHGAAVEEMLAGQMTNTALNAQLLGNP